MEYLNNYLNYYSGENRKEMYKVFRKLVDALRTDQTEALRDICTADCIADFSTAGSFQGIEAIVQGLKWPGPKMDIQKASIWNFVARSNGDKGQQSAYVQNIFALDDGINVFPFVFGGQFCNSFVKTAQGWKLSHIRYDLCYESGNNIFVKDKWTLMDHQIYCGHKPMINTELDAPWYVIPEDCEPQSDAEKIFELQFKKVFGLDTGDFHLTLETVTDDMFQNFSLHGNVNKYNPAQTDSDYHGKRDFNNFLKAKQHKEARLIHGNRMGALRIDGDKAVAVMPRGEDHRLRNRVMNRQNIHSMFTTGTHILYARKCEDGEWRIYKLQYLPLSEAIPVADEVIAYDEYVCGGKDWLEAMAQYIAP